MLVQIPKMLNTEQVAGIRAKLDAVDAPWVDGRATAGHQGARVKNNRQLDEDAPLARALGDAILGVLERHPMFISAALPNRIYPPMFNAYAGGMQFGNHVDGAVRLIPGTGEKIRTDISATLFLSEPDTYDGGELIVDDTYGSHTVKLAAGDLILYPASSLHRVTPVTRGTRVASFFWVQSLVRDHTQRAILFDLDRSIQRLNQRVADDPAMIELTGIYHNLLRQWTEV